MEMQVQQALENAGFTFVQAEPRLAELRNHRPDFIAWASNEYGELVPWGVVEVKSASPKPPELSLPSLARYRDLLGTIDHYIVIDEEWFRADDGLRSLERVDSPQPPRFGSHGELTQAALITSLLTSQLRRGTPVQLDPQSQLKAAAEVLRTAVERGVEIAPGEFAPFARQAMFEASQRLVGEVLEVGYGGPVVSPSSPLAQAMAALGRQRLSGVVLDPFSAGGTLLWAAAKEARGRSTNIDLRGREFADASRELAEAIALSSPANATFQTAGDLFFQPTEADLIVSVPPFGIRMRSQSGRPYELLDGSRTRDGEFVVVDLILRSLNPGGRAVLLVPTSFTFRASGEHYRRFLAENFRVAALIGLQEALRPATSVATVLMVIDKAEPGETFVAQLAGDWEPQLAPGGAALEAALVHIEAPAMSGN